MNELSFKCSEAELSHSRYSVEKNFYFKLKSLRSHLSQCPHLIAEVQKVCQLG